MGKAILKVFLFVALLLTIVACSDAEAERKDTVQGDEVSEKIILKFAVSQPETHTITTGTFKPFMEKVTALTDGQVEFEFYPAEQLGKVADLLELTTTGVTDIGFYIGPYYSSQMPITAAIMDIPGLHSTSYEGSMVLHELSKKSPMLESDFLSNNVRPLFSYAATSSEIWTAGKVIKVPENLKGSKVRVSGELANKAMPTIGASPINITLSELYEGLERGVFDSLVLNPGSTKDYGLGELIKFGTSGVDFGGGATGLIINEKVFQGLPENVQEVLVQVGDEYTEKNARMMDEYSQNAIQEFKENGAEIYALSEEERAQWQKFYNEVEESYLKEKNNHELEKTLEAFREEVKKYN